MNICICGGGNLGHVVAGFIAAQKQHEVSILTRHPQQWNHQLLIETPDDMLLTGTVSLITSDACQAVDKADVVLLCLPGFSMSDVLTQIKPFLRPSTAVGSVVSSTGFYFEAKKLLPPDNPLFGFQRVPFIARTIIYGHRAKLMGFKKTISVAIERHATPLVFLHQLQDLFRTPIMLLDNFYEASLSNSNPLLHPARLYDLWRDWREGTVFGHVPLFYEEWTEQAAQLYIDMDNELQILLQSLPVRKGCIPTVLNYYESNDACSLAAKLRSIDAFKGIHAPMTKVGNGYVPDFHSRYFTEDFPYGLSIVINLAREKRVPTPTMDKIYQWGANIALKPTT